MTFCDVPWPRCFTYFLSLYDHTCSVVYSYFIHIYPYFLKCSTVIWFVYRALHTAKIVCMLFQPQPTCWVSNLKPMRIKSVGGASSINHAKVVVLAWHGGFASRRDNYKLESKPRLDIFLSSVLDCHNVIYGSQYNIGSQGRS